MKTFKIFITVMLFVSMCMPVYSTSADNNENENEITQTEEVAKDTKSEKKKEKDIFDFSQKFFLGFGINLATVLLIIIFIYYPNCTKKEFIFTFIIFNIVIFLLTFVLNKVKISMGAAFGLFAVFSMLRYRTEGISMKDMTYLFIFIAIGLLSAIKLEYYELGIINGVIVISTFILDSNLIIKHEFSKNVLYEDIEMIKPENHPALIEELKKRTGLNIHRITIGKIDYLKDSAVVKVYYHEKKA